jgi:hypothetical protein
MADLGRARNRALPLSGAGKQPHFAGGEQVGELLTRACRRKALRQQLDGL